jgi:hypothetical protein
MAQADYVECVQADDTTQRANGDSQQKAMAEHIMFADAGQRQ